MKRKIPVILLLLLCICFLAGCGCEHIWKEATCAEPMTCTNCGETEGSPRGHSWLVGTCEKAKHCEFCELTEGEAPGHDWVDATHYAPKTCRTCGQTEGESVPHKWIDATYYAPKTCRICKTTKGDPLPRFDADEIFVSAEGFIQLYYDALDEKDFILWRPEQEEMDAAISAIGQDPLDLDSAVMPFVILDEEYVFTGLTMVLVYDEETGNLEGLSFVCAMEEELTQEQEDLCMELCILAFCQINPKAEGKTADDFRKNADSYMGLSYGEYDSLGYQIVDIPQIFGMVIAPDKALF